MDKSSANRPRVKVRLTILTKDDWGRDTPVYDNSKYRPHIVIGNPDQRKPVIDEQGEHTENYLGVCFLGNGRVLELGQQYEVNLALVYHPHVSYDAVIKGATFTAREGGHIVGFGEVLSDPEIRDSYPKHFTDI